MFLITKYSRPMKIFTGTAKTMNVVAWLCKPKILLMIPGLKIQNFRICIYFKSQVQTH